MGSVEMHMNSWEREVRCRGAVFVAASASEKKYFLNYYNHLTKFSLWIFSNSSAYLSMSGIRIL